MTPVYHFTDAGRLPWIVASGELRPGLNRVGTYPCDFLWATTNPLGDRTATAMVAEGGYRRGLIPLIRISLSPEGFERWPDVLRHFPNWTRADVARLENGARLMGQNDFSVWRARSLPVPGDQWIAVEGKMWNSKTWHRVDLATACMPYHEGLAVQFGDTVYGSMKLPLENGQGQRYGVRRMSLETWKGAE
jgi:hypothetical protein